MKKSLFTRYITVFMIIIFISFIILALVIGSNMSAITIEGKRDDVENTAKNISVMISGVYNPQNAQEFREMFAEDDTEFIRYVEYLSNVTGDLRVYVIGADGTVIKAAMEYDSNLFARTSLTEEILSSINGNGSISGYDNLGGALASDCLYYVSPVYSAPENGETVGYVFASTSAKVLNAMIGSTIKTLLHASLWVFFAALVAVYFLSERIISPLKQMSRAAKCYATGNFDIRIPVQGNDEVSELASAFNQMATGLQNLENMRYSFLANVSHDLKTPMTTIAGFIDAILSGAIPPENQNEYLERIRDEVLRLSRLVRQLLDLSRLQAGDRKMEPVTFDICEVSRQIVLSFEQRIEEKELDVEFDFESENLSVVADKDAIHQILYNLCDNAVKFSCNGGKYKVQIKTKDKKAYISVYNEGQGISKEDLPFVFERFYKSDKSRGLDKSGVGLGLYISKTIIDAHRETITVDSEEGKYCRFEFTLPLAENKKPLIEKTAPKD